MARPTTTARSSSSVVRRSALALAAAVALTGCVPPPPAAPPSEGGPPSPAATEAAPGPALDPAVAAAREALAAPAVQLGRDALDVARRVDFSRHEVARGAPMAEALAETAAVAERLAADADALAGAAAALADPPAGTPLAVGRLVDLARRTAEAASAEVAALTALADLDARMDAVVDGWQQRGSRSEIGPRLAGLLEEVAAIEAAAAVISAPPPACTTARDNRTRWAALLRTRTEALRDLAGAAEGEGFDAELDRYQAAPYAEDRATADAEGRACWAARRPFAATPAAVEAAVASLEAALAG